MYIHILSVQPFSVKSHLSWVSELIHCFFQEGKKEDYVCFCSQLIIFVRCDVIDRYGDIFTMYICFNLVWSCYSMKSLGTTVCHCLRTVRKSVCLTQILFYSGLSVADSQEK